MSINRLPFVEYSHSVRNRAGSGMVQPPLLYIWRKGSHQRLSYRSSLKL